jgi:hypothetical protein
MGKSGMLKTWLVVATLMLAGVPRAHGQSFTPATYRHELSCTRLVGDSDGHYQVVSQVLSPAPKPPPVGFAAMGADVTSWDKEFTTTWESADKKWKNTFIITLHQTENPREMRADFDHAVLENGVVVVRFSGTTILPRWP